MRNRTADLLITSELLYQLSYVGKRMLDAGLWTLDKTIVLCHRHYSQGRLVFEKFFKKIATGAMAKCQRLVQHPKSTVQSPFHQPFASSR